MYAREYVNLGNLMRLYIIQMRACVCISNTHMM